MSVARRGLARGSTQRAALVTGSQCL